MQEIILALVSFLTSAFAFAFGAVKLFKRKKPLYFQLLVCAAGCFALQQLSYIVNIWCCANGTGSIGALGIFGCNLFLLSANFGTLDRIVDDGQGSGKTRICAFAAPVIEAVLTAAAFFSWKEKNILSAVMWIIMLLPALPASYYNLKHILLPMDPFELLRATRPCNFAALAFYLITGLYVICSASPAGAADSVLTLIMSLSMLVITISAVKGAKRWGI